MQIPLMQTGEEQLSIVAFFFFFFCFLHTEQQLFYSLNRASDLKGCLI